MEDKNQTEKISEYTITNPPEIQPYFKFSSQNTNIIFKQIDEDKENQTRYYLYITKENIIILKTEQNSKITIKENYKFLQTEVINHSSFAYALYLNRIYIISNPSTVFMVDVQLRRLFRIEIPTEPKLSIPKHHAYTFIDTKLILTGGVGLGNKASTDIITFDIATYRYQIEKIKENNMIGRVRHGSASMLNFIYIVGGFTDQKEPCNKIQVIKFDNNLMNNWHELTINGHQPELLIDPIISMVGEDYMFAFSEYKYPKVWYINIESNNGNMIDLSLLDIPQAVYFSFNFDYEEEEDCFVISYLKFNANDREGLISGMDFSLFLE